MTRETALATAQGLIDLYEPGSRAWAEEEELGILLGTWEPYEGDEDSGPGHVQAVRWTGKTWVKALETMTRWLESWAAFKRGEPSGIKFVRGKLIE